MFLQIELDIEVHLYKKNIQPYQQIQGCMFLILFTCIQVQSGPFCTIPSIGCPICTISPFCTTLAPSYNLSA